LVDITIVLLQTWGFLVKLQDSFAFNIDTADIFKKDFRKTNQSIYFEATNFRNFCLLDTIGLIFIATKVVDGFRLMKRLNVIIITL